MDSESSRFQLWVDRFVAKKDDDLDHLAKSLRAVADDLELR
jgi:hypothetical protein